MVKKNLKIAWIAILGIIGIPITSHAQNAEYLYVYSPSKAEQSFALNDLSKITFTAQDVNLNMTNGTVTALSYGNISVITFKSTSTAINEVKNDSEVKVYFDASNLMIASSSEITAVKVYNLQGLLLKNQTLQSLSASIPLTCPKGVYIVQVINGQGLSIHKIIKK